jgi:hypothetical protein
VKRGIKLADGIIRVAMLPRIITRSYADVLVMGRGTRINAGDEVHVWYACC